MRAAQHVIGRNEKNRTHGRAGRDFDGTKPSSAGKLSTDHQSMEVQYTLCLVKVR